MKRKKIEEEKEEAKSGKRKMHGKNEIKVLCEKLEEEKLYNDRRVTEPRFKERGIKERIREQEKKIVMIKKRSRARDRARVEMRLRKKKKKNHIIFIIVLCCCYYYYVIKAFAIADAFFNCRSYSRYKFGHILYIYYCCCFRGWKGR